MSGTTSPLGFPYPTDTDLVTNGDEAIQSLAEAVDDWGAGATGTLTAGTNITLNTSNCYRRGSVGFLNVNNMATTGAIGAAAVIATLPVGFRPPATIHGNIRNTTDSTMILVSCQADGSVVTIAAIATTKSLHGQIVFPI